MSRTSSKRRGGRSGLVWTMAWGLAAALISYSHATGQSQAIPDAAGLNQALAARHDLTLTAASPDGRWLASVRPDGWVELHDLATDQTPATPLGRAGARVTGLAYSPDGTTLAGGLDDGHILLWDPATGQERRVLPTGQAGAIELLSFSPGGSLIASSAQDHLIKLWNTTTGTLNHVLSGHAGAPLLTLAFEADGHTLISSGGNQIKRWDAVSGREIAAASEFAALPGNVDIGPGGRIAGIARNGQIGLWQFGGGGLQARPGPLPEQEGVDQHAVAFSADGAHVAGIGADNRVRIWDTASGNLRQTLAAGAGVHFTAAAFDPGRGVLALGADNQTLTLWDIGTGALVAAPIPTGNTLATLAYTAGGAELIGQDQAGRIAVWSLPSGAPRYAAQGAAPVAGGAWSVAAASPANPVGAAPSKADATASAANASQTTPAADSPALAGQGRRHGKFSKKAQWKGITALAINRDGSLLGATGRNGTLRILGGDGQRRWTLRGHHGQNVTGAAFLPDGKRMVSIGRDSEATIWDTTTGRTTAVLRGAEQPPRAVATAPDGHIAVAGEDTRILYYNGQGKLERIFKGHRDFVNSLAFSPDGRTLASGSADTALILWSVDTGQALRTLPCGAEINALAFSPDGKRVAVGTADGLVGLWETGGRLVRIFSGHSAAVRSVAFSRDGQRLASGGEDAKVAIWSLPDGKLRKTLAETSPVNGLAFGQGRHLFTGGEDDRLDDWDADSGGRFRPPQAEPRAAAHPALIWLGRVLDWLVPTAGAAIPAAPGGPLLIITPDPPANPARVSPDFSAYYAEILRAEGLNEFAVSPMGSVNAALLSAYDVAILGPMALTGPQVALLNTWVNAGGNLIAMRPDPLLAGLLGITPAGIGLAEGYLLVNSGQLPGNGIGSDGQPMQFHGTADPYVPTAGTGTVGVARLYSDFSTPTAHSAITLRGGIGAGGGSAAAFGYDLATAIVYSHQGNPAWAVQERDGLSPIRSDDKFYGNASFDSQADWVDLLREVAVPQADEQQRLLVNLILAMNQGQKPLPRFWYLPFGKKAAVVMTGDDHANGGTAGRFDQFIALSPQGCSLDKWECVRGTSYLYPDSPLTDAQAGAYAAQGFEVGLHVNTNCADFTPATLETFYVQQLAAFQTRYPGIAPLTQRHHCIAWSDWTTGATVQVNHGIRLDTSYYFWPPMWVQDRPGFFTASATPMRFAAPDGGLIDNYLAVSQMTDESGQTYPFTINTLLDRAIGPEEDYGTYTLNAHTDTAIETESTTAVASAQTRGIPVVTAAQMLGWLDGKGGAAFASPGWNATSGQLSFGVTLPGLDAQGKQPANGLQAMLPLHFAGRTLAGLTKAGAAVAYSVRPVHGMEYALFTVATGSTRPTDFNTYVARYTADTTPPQAGQLSPAPGGTAKQTAVVSVAFDEAMDPASINASSFRLRDGNGAAVAARPSYSAYTRTASLTPTAPLAAATSYTATLSGTGTTPATDLAGNPLGADRVWSFTTETAPCSAQPCSLWDPGTRPGIAAINDPNPVELGVWFKTDANGWITGLRFYKGAGNTGTHTGSLWNGGGQLLARATFANETAGGWQQVDFASPVAVTAGTAYVASYHAPNGFYAGDNNFFTAGGVDNPPLHAPANAAVQPGNGLYAYGANPAFPINTYLASNYWVDVVFSNPTANPPAITTASLTPATAGLAYTASLAASGGLAPYAWSISGGSLPAGLSLDPASGHLSGIPTTAGTANFTARVVDATGTAASRAFSLMVQPGNLDILTDSLPDATVGAAYAATLTAAGGNPPYTWSLAAGSSLPAGLGLEGGSGVIGGVPSAAGTYSFTVRVATAENSATQSLSLKVGATPSSFSIWPATAVPGRVDSGPDRPVELGVKFKSDVAGAISGIRFYKAATNTGPHVANLWNGGNGNRLATASFVHETASGWQQADFATPVAIAANTVYVASYHTGTGHYSEDINYFQAGGVDAPPLHALRNGASGPDGVFVYGNGGVFPNRAATSTNYWVDVVFTRTLGAATAPRGLPARTLASKQGR